MTRITRLGSKSEDWEEQKSFASYRVLMKVKAKKKNCETNHFSVLLNIDSLLRRGRTEGRAYFLFFVSLKICSLLNLIVLLKMM